MKKIFIIVFLFCTSFLYSQENYINKKWKIKAAKSSHQIIFSEDNESKNYKSANNYQLELSYGVLKYLEVGIYGGYSIHDSFKLLKNITYGFNINFHFLPFITEGKLLKFVDTYISANYGTNYMKLGPYMSGGVEIVETSYNTDQGIGGGIALYPIDKLGIFTEYTFGHYFFKGNHRFKVGLIYRF